VYRIFDKLVTSGASIRVTGFAFSHCDSECAVLRYPFDYEHFPRWCARRFAPPKVSQLTVCWCSSSSFIFLSQYWISGVVVHYVRMFDARHECVGTCESNTSGNSYRKEPTVLGRFWEIWRRNISIHQFESREVITVVSSWWPLTWIGKLVLSTLFQYPTMDEIISNCFERVVIFSIFLVMLWWRADSPSHPTMISAPASASFSRHLKHLEARGYLVGVVPALGFLTHHPHQVSRTRGKWKREQTNNQSNKVWRGKWIWCFVSSRRNSVESIEIPKLEQEYVPRGDDSAAGR